MLRSSLTLIASVALLAACNPDDGQNPRPSDGDADIEGRVSDSDSTARTGGSGTVDAASRVEAVVVRDGQAMVIGEAEVDADAEYAIELDEDAAGETVMVRAMNEGGTTLASTLITRMDESGDGDVYIAAPMSTETSVEAEVWLSSQQRYSQDEAADSAEVRVRIDVDAAVSARDSQDAGSEIDALADAMVSSAAAEARVWTDAGAELYNRTRAEATADAMASYDLALAEGGDVEGSWEQVLIARNDVAMDAGLSARQRADAASASNLMVRAVLRERASADTSDAMLVQSGWLEARATADALVATYDQADVDSSTRDMASSIAADLRADAKAAGSVEDTAQAWSTYETSLVGESEFDGSLMDSSFDLTLINEAALRAAVDDSASALATLESGLDTAIVDESGNDTLDVEALATLVVDGWVAYRAGVLSDVELLFNDSDDAALATEVILDANGRFAVAPD